MEIFFLVSLFVFWALFWSFSSVIIHRLKSGEGGICAGRSHCWSCQHPLSAKDLVPIFSWLAYRAKCVYCKEKIPGIYPLLELSCGFLFATIWYFLIDVSLLAWGNIEEIWKLFFWLAIGFLSIIYIFYDILFLEIHEWVMATWISLALIGLVFQSFWIPLIASLPLVDFDTYQFSLILAFTLAGLAGFYSIMIRELKEIYDIAILLVIGTLLWFSQDLFWIGVTQHPLLSGMTGAFCIFVFFFLQIVLSGGRALWGWDLRIAIMIWLLLGTSLSFAGAMSTYIIWSIIGIVMLLHTKYIKKQKNLSTQVPFGPFLALWFFVTLFYQDYILALMALYL